MKKLKLFFCLTLCIAVIGCGSSEDVDKNADLSSKGAASDSGHLLPDKKFSWKLVTTWPKNFPALGTQPVHLAALIKDMTQGQLDITVYAASELVPAKGVFDAVANGSAQMGHGAAYYWQGKMPASVFFTSIPFGMNAQEMNSWLHHGDGIKLWRELYAPFGVIPFPCGNTGVQMAGWFNREINQLSDLKGLKMRIPGIGAEILNNVGVVTTNHPGGEVFIALDTGVIDAAEWVGPYNDLALGIHRAAKYYYYPGWQEPGPTLELIINKSAWDTLPAHIKTIVEVAIRAVNQDMLDEFTIKNSEALMALKTHGVEPQAIPSNVLEELRKHAHAIFEKRAEQDPMTKKVWNSYKSFQEKVSNYHDISEKAYYLQR